MFFVDTSWTLLYTRWCGGETNSSHFATATSNPKETTMTSSEKIRKRIKAERQAKITKINSQYELIENGELTVSQNKILESDEYNKWIAQKTRCFDRNGNELSTLTQTYKDLTNSIIFKSMDINWAIYLFEGDVIRRREFKK